MIKNQDVIILNGTFTDEITTREYIDFENEFPSNVLKFVE